MNWSSDGSSDDSGPKNANSSAPLLRQALLRQQQDEDKKKKRRKRDKYDVEYDRGKVKKIREKKAMRFDNDEEAEGGVHSQTMKFQQAYEK